MNFKSYLKNNTVYLDGGMGTLLQKKGLKPGEQPERWNISHPEEIIEIHEAYYNAGSNVIATNTFGANVLKYSQDELSEVIKAAFKNANEAKKRSVSAQEKFIALDVGPTGKLLAPYGDLDFEDAVGIFKRTIEIGVECGCDLILIETMNDSYETKAALLAAKETTSLPVIVTNAYGADGKLMTGASPEAMVALLEGMGASAIGANCSFGPEALRPVIERMLAVASVPVVLKPNAGLPKEENGCTYFDVTPDDFAKELASLQGMGLRVMGGCCGTTPEYIKALVTKTKDIPTVPVREKNLTTVSSYTHAVTLKDSPILIGERINPTGKKKFKEALLNNDINYILDEAIKQEGAGAHILDVNVGLPGIDETKMLTSAVTEIQAVTSLPLQIDTASPKAMESALRRYNGKALINSVNGKKESMETVFPLAKKYGGAIIALTLDENGIPESASERVAIAKRILKEAKRYGIKKKDIIFDTLVMTVSTGADAAKATLSAMKEIKTKLGCHTSLGVSNVSYGLPNRDAVNGTFFAVALENGLSAAIMNPYSIDMMRTYYTYRALKGLDENCLDYIGVAESFSAVSTADVKRTDENEASTGLASAIEKGFKDRCAEITRELIKTKSPIEIVDSEIIPALDKVGAGYEAKKIYLPQLLMSAEAAKAAFEVIKSSQSTDGEAKKGKFVIATVEGDVHDIGKNIVKLLLENYGFSVIDLGKDVKAEAVLEAVRESGARLVGLSALMTTTLPAMEKTVKLLKNEIKDIRIVVGGAVLTEEYAERIGADKYAADAMETVRYSEEVIKNEL